MKTAQSIINDARFELTYLIVTLMRKLDAYFKTGKKNLITNEDGVIDGIIIDFTECVRPLPAIRVEVDNSYLDIEDRCYEYRPVDSIVTRDDCHFYLCVDDRDIDAEDISTDELVLIAKVLEDTYNKAE